MTERLPLLVHNRGMPSTSRRTAAKSAPPRGNGRPAPTKGRGAEKNAAASNGGSSERRHALVEIAAALFAEQGFKATTVREIGDAAGVLSGSLYHHFDSKETIVDEILSSYLDSLMQTYREIVGSSSDPAETLRELVRAAFRSLGPHRAAITVLQNERNYLAQLPRFAYLTKAESDIQRLWTKVLGDGIKSGAFRSDLDPKIVYRFIRDSVWVAVRWFVPSGRLTADQLADQYLTLMMEGLNTPAPKG
jgi:AcrR family transcriptional regulator